MSVKRDVVTMRQPMRVYVLIEDRELEDGRIEWNIKGIYETEDKIRAALGQFQAIKQTKYKSITYSLHSYKLQ